LEDEKKKWERDEAVADHQLSWKEDILPNWSKKCVLLIHVVVCGACTEH
jgi:hypothetical protein